MAQRAPGAAGRFGRAPASDDRARHDRRPATGDPSRNRPRPQDRARGPCHHALVAGPRSAATTPRHQRRPRHRRKPQATHPQDPTGLERRRARRLPHRSTVPAALPRPSTSRPTPECAEAKSPDSSGPTSTGRTSASRSAAPSRASPATPSSSRSQGRQRTPQSRQRRVHHAYLPVPPPRHERRRSQTVRRPPHRPPTYSWSSAVPMTRWSSTATGRAI